MSVEAAQKNYKKSVEKGILKIMSKMGISLLQCYHGAQIFEAYGLGRDVVELCFKWVAPTLTLPPPPSLPAASPTRGCCLPLPFLCCLAPLGASALPRHATNLTALSSAFPFQSLCGLESCITASSTCFTPLPQTPLPLPNSQLKGLYIGGMSLQICL